MIAGHLFTTGAKRMCSTETVGRSILGIATVEATRAKTFSCHLWPRHGGDISLFLITINVAYQRKLNDGFVFVSKQVMLACERYNLVHEFFRKMQKSSIPNALAYRGVL